MSYDETDDYVDVARERIAMERAVTRKTDVLWAHRVENWRGDDYYEGAPPEDRSAM